MRAGNRGLARNAEGRRSGPVEEAIAWAWRDELPKAPRLSAGPLGYVPALTKVTRYGDYLSLIDLHGVNAYGAVPDFSATSFPHADALRVAEAVRALDAIEIAMPEDWDPAPELAAHGAHGRRAVAEAWRRLTVSDAEGRPRLRVSLSDLVVGRAIMGAPDDLAMGAVTLEAERAANGRERWFVERVVDLVIGFDADGGEVTRPERVEGNGTDKSGNALPGAYRKLYLDPDPVPVIMARAEHEIWHAALAILADDLSGTLSEIAVQPTRTVARPWEDAAPASRILPDLAPNRWLRRAA